MSICITGGTGYIGSHCAVALIQNGYDVIILDNLSNSSTTILDDIYNITKVRPTFYEIDICDYDWLHTFFKNHKNKIACVLHCAALKSIPESVTDPIKYYENNLIGSVNLLKAMIYGNCKKLVFSSSATVYGNPEILPIPENHPIHAINPYGTTKIMVENILKDIAKADNEWQITILRYFNPVGYHDSGLLKESRNKAINLFPFIKEVLDGKHDNLTIYGGDWNTPDGTCIRDYIHIMDIASGHVEAINKINDNKLLIANLGTGQGYSVLEVVKEFERITNKDLPYIITERRTGDTESYYAYVEKARDKLGWKSTKTLEDMCMSYT